jgi:hypothetical protein
MRMMLMMQILADVGAMALAACTPAAESPGPLTEAVA